MNNLISTEDSLYFVQSLIPKNPTQAAEFIQKYPNFDGRRVRIAIWDTGVDPASEGLQITTEGKPKLIHMCDTSGSGDVRMLNEVKPDNVKKIKLLSNREIIIPESWNIGDQSVKIGMKPAVEIFPAAVISRLSKDYKENVWNKEISRIQSQVLQQKKRSNQIVTNITDSESTILKECLDLIEKNYEYPIPIFDCIVFLKDTWVACVDTTCLNPSLKLEDMPLLYPFDKKRQFSNFGGKTNLNFGVNIHDNGNLLEIVSCSGSHGTHVASIAAGNFPSKPECNGIAPGSEIVSIKIADTRLVAMETGMSLAYAVKVTIDLKCDIVNLSFGEPSMQPNCGRICEIMQELVIKHGIIFCSSSGNDGPGLSTVGSPGGTTDMLFGISPLVFPDMVESNYSLPVDKLSELSPQVYTWASRGPTTDGSLGIHVAAPGSAITSVATWQNRSLGLMNGSSMSSPNACGGLSLLISAAHQLGKPITPWLMGLCTANTASIIPNISRLSQGNGLLQIKSAFTYLEKYWTILDSQLVSKQPDINVNGESFTPEYAESIILNQSNELMRLSEDLFIPNAITNSLVNLVTKPTPVHLFRIKCSLSNGNRGIFLKEPYETIQKRHFNVNIAPDFDEDFIKISDQVNIQLYLKLVCSASWVSCPRFLHFFNQERSISVQVDPTILNRGLPEFQLADSSDVGDYGIYFTEIEFHCSEFPDLGPLARLPIMVYKSESMNTIQWSQVTKFSSQKKTVRHFLATPPNSDSLVITIKPNSIVEGSGRFELRIVQSQQQSSSVISELSKSFAFDRKMNMTINESVGYMLTGSSSSNVEIVLAQYWSAINDAELKYVVDFHGLKISTDVIKMLSSDHHFRLHMESHLQLEEISPSISLNFWILPLKPSKEEISCVEKLVSGDKELLNLELSYSFNNPKPGHVGIFCPALGNFLYENDFYSQMYQIFDCNGRIVGTGDYKPEQAFRRMNKYCFWLEKGDFKVQLNIRHRFMSQLERLKDQVIHIYFKTFQGITFEFSKTMVDVNHNKKLSGSKLNFSLGKGEKMYLYIITNVTKIPKAFVTGSYLSGTLSLYKNEVLKKAVCYPFQYIFTSNPSLVEKGENVQNFKLPLPFADSLMSYLKNNESSRTSPIQSLTQKEDEFVSSTAIRDIVEILDKIPETEFQDQIGTLIEKPEFKDGLARYLMTWVKEFHKKPDRNSIEKLIKLINGDKYNTELQLIQLRLLQKNGWVDLKSDERWVRIEDIYNNLVKFWDTKELAEYIGIKHSDATIPFSKEQKTKFDQSKQHLTEVLSLYGLCLCENILETENNYSEDDNYNCNDMRDKLNSIFYQLCRFVSPWDNNATCLPFFVMHSFVFKCYGRMLKLLLKSYEDHSTLHVLILIKEVLLKLEWNVLAKHYEMLIPVRHPVSCQPPMKK